MLEEVTDYGREEFGRCSMELTLGGLGARLSVTFGAGPTAGLLVFGWGSNGDLWRRKPISMARRRWR